MLGVFEFMEREVIFGQLPVWHTQIERGNTPAKFLRVKYLRHIWLDDLKTTVDRTLNDVRQIPEIVEYRFKAETIADVLNIMPRLTIQDGRPRTFRDDVLRQFYVRLRLCAKLRIHILEKIIDDRLVLFCENGKLPRLLFG